MWWSDPPTSHLSFFWNKGGFYFLLDWLYCLLPQVVEGVVLYKHPLCPSPDSKFHRVLVISWSTILCTQICVTLYFFLMQVFKNFNILQEILYKVWSDFTVATVCLFAFLYIYLCMCVYVHKSFENKLKHHTHLLLNTLWYFLKIGKWWKWKRRVEKLA